MTRTEPLTVVGGGLAGVNLGRLPAGEEHGIRRARVPAVA